MFKYAILTLTLVLSSSLYSEVIYNTKGEHAVFATGYENTDSAVIWFHAPSPMLSEKDFEYRLNSFMYRGVVGETVRYDGPNLAVAKTNDDLQNLLNLRKQSIKVRLSQAAKLKGLYSVLQSGSKRLLESQSVQLQARKKLIDLGRIVDQIGKIEPLPEKVDEGSPGNYAMPRDLDEVVLASEKHFESNLCRRLDLAYNSKNIDVYGETFTKLTILGKWPACLEVNHSSFGTILGSRSASVFTALLVKAGAREVTTIDDVKVLNVIELRTSSQLSRIDALRIILLAANRTNAGDLIEDDILYSSESFLMESYFEITGLSEVELEALIDDVQTRFNEL